MVQIDTLEHITEPRQLTKSAVTHRPVGQQLRQSREYTQRLTAHAGICRKESWHHDIGTVFAHRSVFRIESLPCQRTSRRILGLGILSLDACLEQIQRAAELLKRGRMIAVVGIAHTLKGTAQTDGGHGQCSALRSGHSAVHILYAAGLGFSAAGIKVDLEVLDGLKGHLQLQILRLAGIGRCSHTVGKEQPVVVQTLVDVIVVNKAKGKVESRRHDVTRALSEHVAYIGKESRQRHAVLVAISEAHIAHHHQSARHTLGRLVPLLVFKRLLGGHSNLHLHGRIHLVGDFYLVVVHHLVFQLIRFAVLGLGGDDQTLALLAMGHSDGCIGLDFYFLFKSLFVLGQSLFFLGFILLLFSLWAWPSATPCRLVLVVQVFPGRLVAVGGTRRLAETVVGLFQERHMVVEFLQIERAIDVGRTVHRNHITQRRAVFQIGASCPIIGRVVAGITVHPIEDGQQVERQLVGCLERLVVVQWLSPTIDAVFH